MLRWLERTISANIGFTSDNQQVVMKKFQFLAENFKKEVAMFKSIWINTCCWKNLNQVWKRIPAGPQTYQDHPGPKEPQKAPGAYGPQRNHNGTQGPLGPIRHQAPDAFNEFWRNSWELP